ncbi:large ribosomal subunit protein uL14m-like [Mytilus trossulus]|uniref:large ribosomal subunit protein uL14m-like n=1 Tax=Mytilus trossulus TaxID=6551 RepID=UPI003004CDDC
MFPVSSTCMNIANRLTKLTCLTSTFSHNKLFSTSQCLMELRLRARVRVIDNSPIGKAAATAGKPGKIMHVYNVAAVGRIGDKVMINIMGQKKKGYIVGCRQKQKTNVPRFDTNNVVLVEDSGTPTGTRIRHPLPSCLRHKRYGEKHSGEFTKILSIATKFV